MAGEQKTSEDPNKWKERLRGGFMGRNSPSLVCDSQSLSLAVHSHLWILNCEYLLAGAKREAGGPSLRSADRWIQSFVRPRSLLPILALLFRDCGSGIPSPGAWKWCLWKGEQPLFWNVMQILTSRNTILQNGTLSLREILSGKMCRTSRTQQRWDFSIHPHQPWNLLPSLSDRRKIKTFMKSLKAWNVQLAFLSWPNTWKKHPGIGKVVHWFYNCLA